VHGVGGATGTFLTGVFAVSAVGETAGLIEGNGRQVLIQLYGIVVTIIWSGVLSFALLKLIEFFIPLRVRTEDEQMGLDVALHGEAIQ
jgi:Amt family ammonium transporter